MTDRAREWDGADRRQHPRPEELSNMHRRLDTQDKLLLEIRDKIVSHIAEEQQIKPALDELLNLWRGSKVAFRILGLLAAGGAAIVSLLAWAKDHVKL